VLPSGKATYNFLYLTKEIIYYPLCTDSTMAQEVQDLRQAIVPPTPDEEQTLDDLAREVLMLDENNKSLIPGFTNILKNTSMSRIPSQNISFDFL
jgi:hypothetical protein